MSTFNPKPGYICSFRMMKNPKKTEAKHPDLVLVNHMSKKGNMVPKNFTIKINGEDVWCQAKAYKQEDGTVKFTIEKTDTKQSSPKPSQSYQQGSAEDFI